MRKELYLPCELEIVKFSSEDVITTSGEDDETDMLNGFIGSGILNGLY